MPCYKIVIINFLILLVLANYLLLVTIEALGVKNLSKNLEHSMKCSIVSRIVGVDEVYLFTDGATPC